MSRPPLFPTAIGLCLTLATSALVPSAVAAEERLRKGSSFETRGWERIQGEGETTLWRADLQPTETAPPGSDTEAFLAGKVTIAPLRFDWTDREQLPTLAERLAKLR